MYLTAHADVCGIYTFLHRLWRDLRALWRYTEDGLTDIHRECRAFSGRQLHTCLSTECMRTRRSAPQQTRSLEARERTLGQTHIQVYVQDACTWYGACFLFLKTALSPENHGSDWRGGMWREKTRERTEGLGKKKT